MSTKIEWAEETLNAIVGCRKYSPGCENCYAITTANVRRNHPNEKIRSKFAPTVSGSSGKPNWTGQVTFNESVLLAAIKRKKPTVYFVNSLSDLFYDGVSDEIIDKHFAAFAIAPQHRFLVLTKRADRMRDYLLDVDMKRDAIIDHIWAISKDPKEQEDVSGKIMMAFLNKTGLPNVWLGVSCEDQKTADERIPLLLQTPAAVRFLSVEPMLGELDLSSWLGELTHSCGRCGFVGEVSVFEDAALKLSQKGRVIACPNCKSTVEFGLSPAVNWVICGGESGPNARPFYVKYARDIRDQCKAAGVPFFLKQLGAMPIDEDGSVMQIKDRKGGNIDEFPEDLRVREMPEN